MLAIKGVHAVRLELANLKGLSVNIKNTNATNSSLQHISKGAKPFKDAPEVDMKKAKLDRARDARMLSRWSLFQETSTGCACGDTAIEDLKEPEDKYVVCPSTGDIPECFEASDGASETTEGIVQAGGHAGDFIRVDRDRIGKINKAFAVNSSIKDRKRGGRAWVVYMEMWCIKRLFLKNVASKVRRRSSVLSDTAEFHEHPLFHFVFGQADTLDRMPSREFEWDSWAPQFHGICKVGNADYLLLDDIFNAYNKACQMDLKLGKSTYEPNEGFTKRKKLDMVDVMSGSAAAGVRVEGFNVYNPVKNSWNSSKREGMIQTRMLTSIDYAFERFLAMSETYPLEVQTDLIRGFHRRLGQITEWFNEKGRVDLRPIGMSVVLAYECEPDLEVDRLTGLWDVNRVPQVKLIDFAHLFWAKQVNWEDNDVHEGLQRIYDQMQKRKVIFDSMSPDAAPA